MTPTLVTVSGGLVTVGPYRLTADDAEALAARLAAAARLARQGEAADGQARTIRGLARQVRAVRR